MKKYSIDFIISENILMDKIYSLLKLKPKQGEMPDINPGQFVQVYIPNSKTTYLRRPISINNVDYDKNEMWLLVRDAGAGTHSLIESEVGSTLNIILPLGNGFSVVQGRALLVGGGVGVAPLLYLGKVLKKHGSDVSFLLGAKTENGLLELDEFAKYGKVYVSTEDGSMGEKGFVTTHSAFSNEYDIIQSCGPSPMMKAVARLATESGVECEVSLENVMACGVGACLCCVEDTSEGNVCVCKEGPVFNISKLKW